MTHRFFSDAEDDGKKESDFPIICESSLDDNPYVLMARARIGYESSYGKVLPNYTIDCESLYGIVLPNDTILKLRRMSLCYRRYRSRVCSFYVRGECTSGAECPYRHDMPETGELSQQNIKDCYYGVNDPVAHKLLNKAHEMPSLVPPEDESIRTLYVGGLDDRITEQDLRDHFYAHGEIESIKMVLQQACAFVSYTTREVTEKAAEELANKLVIKGLRLKLLWGRPQVQKPMCYFNIPLPPPPLQPERTFSPSMDPQRMGAVVPSQQGDSTMPSVLGENRRGLEQQHGGHYAAAAAYPYPGMPLPSPQRQIYKP